jgi:hypothetical protein
MPATTKSQKNVNVTLSLSNADYEWFEAYANVTGKTFSEAASSGMAEWLSEEGLGWLHIKYLIEAHSNGSLVKATNETRTAKGKKAACKSPASFEQLIGEEDAILARGMGITLA